MSVNKYQSHVLVLPEDDANRQLANGFLMDPALLTRKTQVLEEAGGWMNVLALFKSDHLIGMERYPGRFMVLLMDFDNDVDRLDNAKATIPDHLTERVFILGTLSEPETLKADLGTSDEDIGSAMARDCREGTDTTWEHPLLRHKATELDRLREYVRPILFESI
jgi:hypothetical protein